MILGISGSPRSKGITASAIKEVLSNCVGETKYISLSGKQIAGCVSCLGCTKDNVCIIKDDFSKIAEAMREAEAIVLGVPNYYNVPNVLSHALLERSFCFRHQGIFGLQEKPIVILSTGYSSDEENSQVLNIVEHFANSNRMNVVSKFLVGAFSQCYSCKYGRTCVDGNIVKKNGLVDVVTSDMLPPKFDKQLEALDKCRNAAQLLNALSSAK